MLDPADLAECGGELIFVVDHTPGGLPLGPTVTSATTWRSHRPSASSTSAACPEHPPPPTVVLLAVDGPHHVIDWEHAQRGDPAYDLAIVTRAVRRPFQIADGLERLLDAYCAAGGREVTANEIRLHELCLVAGWYRAALAGADAHAAQAEIDRMRSLLRRLR